MCDYNLSEIFDITTKEDAIRWKTSYIRHIRENNTEIDGDYQKAFDIANQNIGYYSGYGSHEDRRRIEDLFNTEHPFFGSIEKNGPPTLKEAFEMGLKLGENEKNLSR